MKLCANYTEGGPDSVMLRRLGPGGKWAATPTLPSAPLRFGTVVPLARGGHGLLADGTPSIPGAVLSSLPTEAAP